MSFVIQLGIYFVIAGLCGLADQAINGTSGASFLLCVAAGVLGCALGPWAAHQIGLPQMWVQIGPTQLDIVWVLVGGILLATLSSIFARQGRYK
jgi:uncharacterized membrane protein YeaQ/YmgE (transglycosylase-associated protein family)